MSGAYVDYYLKDAPSGKVSLEFLDAAGKVIRSYTSQPAEKDTTRSFPNDSLAQLADAARRDSVSHDAADSVVSARAGTNRFVWSLRYEPAKTLKNTVLDEGMPDGPVVPPGEYAVRLIVEKDSLTRRFTVVADPRVKTPTVDLIAQYELAVRTHDRLNELVDATTRLEGIQAQLDARAAQVKDESYAKRVGDAAKDVRKKLEAVRAELYEIGCHVDQCTLDQPIKLYNMLLSLNYQVQSGDYGPTTQHSAIYSELSGKLTVQLQKLQQIEDTDLSAFNKLLDELKVPGIFVPARKTIS